MVFAGTIRHWSVLWLVGICCCVNGTCSNHLEGEALAVNWFDRHWWLYRMESGKEMRHSLVWYRSRYVWRARSFTMHVKGKVFGRIINKVQVLNYIIGNYSNLESNQSIKWKIIFLTFCIILHLNLLNQSQWFRKALSLFSLIIQGGPVQIPRLRRNRRDRE